LLTSPFAVVGSAAMFSPMPAYGVQAA